MEDFDLIAKEYDTDQRIARAAAVSGEIRLHIQDGRTKTAIEYGCGTGLVGLQLADEFEHLTLIDSSREMIAQVDQKLQQSGISSVVTQCVDFMDAASIQLRADYIFLSLVLHHIHDTEGIFRRFYEVLKNGGHLIAVDLDAEDGSFHKQHHGFTGHNGFNPSDLIALSSKIGFTSAEAKIFYQGSKSVDGKESPYSFFIFDAAK